MNNEKFNNYDVFHAFLVEDADFDGYIELPVIKTSNELSERVRTKDVALSKLEPRQLSLCVEPCGLRRVGNPEGQLL